MSPKYDGRAATLDDLGALPNEALDQQGSGAPDSGDTRWLL